MVKALAPRPLPEEAEALVRCLATDAFSVGGGGGAGGGGGVGILGAPIIYYLFS